MYYDAGSNREDRVGLRSSPEDRSSTEGLTTVWTRHSAFAVMVALPLTALGHHSVGGNYDSSETIELEGEITEVFWRNPHVGFTLTTTDDAGRTVVWELSSHSLSIMRRMDVTEPFVAAGDHVRVAGWPARRGGGMFVNNMLLPSGDEFVFAFGAEPADLRWSGRLWGTNERWYAETGASTEAELGLFRVWSTTLAGGDWSLWLRDYPLARQAQAARAEFDPVRDDPLRNCALKGMPAAMSAPYPLEFVDRGDTVAIRLEEYDVERTIYMNAGSAPDPVPAILGHSVGRWENRDLVVETTAVNWGHFDGRGIPTTAATQYLERFSPSADGSWLDYEITVTDPAVFTQPVTMRKTWVWLPDVRIEPYDCANRD